MGTIMAAVRSRDVPPGTSRGLEGQDDSRQVFVDERGVRRRLIRAGERGLAVAVAGILMMGVGGMVGAPWVPHLKLPLIGLAGPAVRPDAPQEAPSAAPQPDPSLAETRRATKPVPAPSPGPSVPVLAVARVSQTTNAATGPAQVTNPATSTVPVPSTGAASPPASPASGGPTPQPSPDPSPSPTAEPSGHGQTVAAAHSQSRADPSPGPRSSAKAK
jgi:hypothetical protein